MMDNTAIKWLAEKIIEIIKEYSCSNKENEFVEVEILSVITEIYMQMLKVEKIFK